MRYRYNHYCSCARCRAHGFMGPAVLITIGVLFLLDQMGHVHWMDFGFTWPALLIVIGLIKLLEHSASTYGHIPREYNATLPPNPGQPIPPGTPRAIPDIRRSRRLQSSRRRQRSCRLHPAGLAGRETRRQGGPNG